MFDQERKQLESLAFTVQEKHLGLLESITGDIGQRFNVTINIEKTSYTQHDDRSGSHLRWVHLEGENIQLMRCAKVSSKNAVCVYQITFELLSFTLDQGVT